jgi:hypothetical protein
MAYGDDAGQYGDSFKGLGGFTTAHSAGVIVVGSLVALILIRRGFRGFSAGGAGVRLG